MALMNYTTMQITAKIVYYGPGLCGKTSNLQWIHQKTAGRSRGEMLSLETETDRTLFFDLLPLDVGVIGGMKVRLQLYTVPGQVFYNATRRLVLKGVDGVVFVADSQLAARDANRESLQNLVANLEEMGLGLESVPLVFQYNKRDIRNIIPVETLEEDLNPRALPHFEAAAIHGLGVFETLKEISRLSLGTIKAKIAEEDKKQAHPAAAPPPAVPARPAPPAPTVPPEFAAARAEVDHALSSLLPELAPEGEQGHLEVEFAEEDTGKHAVRRVRTRAALDIQAELAKLRALAVAAAPARHAPASSEGEVERLFQDLALPDRRREIRQRASLEVPASLLLGSSEVRFRLSFMRDGHEEPLNGGVVVKIAGNRRVRALNVHLDLELRGK
jgi:signal recognition particle receptor subunit beta